MKEYEFELLFKTNNDEEVDIFIDRLYEAGCDDALIGSGKKGVLALTFTREAESASEAFESAIRDVKTVIPAATLIEAKPDYAGVSDIAEIIGCSRQNIQKAFNNVDAPLPIHSGSLSIWHMYEALAWFSDERKAGKYVIEEQKIDVARMAKEVNFAIEQTRMETVRSSFVHLLSVN